MKHPDQAALALHAGGNLGPLARWRTARHLAKCARCRGELTEFEAVRAALPGLAELPGVCWSRLAAEMQANIRLGLAAGECVRGQGRRERLRPFFAGARAGVAFASVVALVLAGLVLQHPAPRGPSARSAVVELQSTPNGIEVSAGDAALRLLHAGAEAKDVTYTPGAQGSLRARYVDSETDYVTVASVYAN
jgi:anti-sigma factor RsiW